MKSYLTGHARARMQQRAISKLQIVLIELFGETVDQKGGTEYAFVPWQTIADLRQAIDKLEGICAVSTQAGKVITAMHRTRRLRRA